MLKGVSGNQKMTNEEMIADLRRKIDEYYLQYEKRRGENSYTQGVYSGMIEMAEYVVEELDG